MTDQRLDIRNKCLTVYDQGGCLLIKGQTGQLGTEHILCVQGDERVLADAFDEYLATDVFEHYVKCRDINILRDANNTFDSDDILGLEFNFIHTDPGEKTVLNITTGQTTATVTAEAAGTLSSPVFQFGDENNTIQFTEPSTKRVKIGDLWYQVTFVEFCTAVFTIDRISQLLLPEGSIAGIDELMSEIIFQDDSVAHVPTAEVKLDDLLGEIVYRNTDIPVVGSNYHVLIDELLGELVYKDISLDYVAPYDITTCDVPNIECNNILHLQQRLGAASELDRSGTTYANLVVDPAVIIDSGVEPFTGARSFALAGQRQLKTTNVADLANFAVGESNWTVSFWFHQLTNTYSYLYSAYVAGYHGWHVYILNQSIVAQFGTSAGVSWDVQLQSAPLALNEWHYLTWTRSGNTYALYIDGVKVDDATIGSSVDFITSPSVFAIGGGLAAAPSSVTFNGYMQDIIVAPELRPFQVPAALRNTCVDPF